ncbi:MAG: hypothetical protein ACYCXF_02160 [Thermoleophilia bacterium]
MMALTRLTIKDYVRSWKIAVEVVLLLIFLSMGILEKGQPAGNLLAIAFFSLIIVPVVTLRVSRSAASIKCRYILATGLSRSSYLLAVALASFLIAAALLLVALVAAVFKAPEIFDVDFFGRFMLLVALVSLNTAICVFFSRLLVGRWGTGAAILLIIFTAAIDQNSFKQPLAKSIVDALKNFLPWASRAITTISGSQENWLIILGQIVGYTIIIGFVASYFFQKKELIYKEE